MTSTRSVVSKGRAVLLVRVVIVVVALWLAAVPLPRELVEGVYAQGIYPIVRQLVTGLSSRTTLVLFDWLLVAGVTGLFGWWCWRLTRAGRKRRLRVLMLLAGRTLVLAAALYVAFLSIWGLNYRRQSLTTRLDYVGNRLNVAELESVTAVGVDRLNKLYGSIEAETWPQLNDLPDKLGPAFVRVQQRLGVSLPTPGLIPRRSILTPYFRRAGIDGMLDPFFLQILINDTVLPFERPFVTAHEWAHVAGYAHEAEANFVAWLSCLQGDDLMQYSGWLYLMGRLLNALPESSRSSFVDRIGSGPQADFAAVRARLSRVVPVVQRSARRINDQYLRANRVSSGVASYAEVVQLVVGTDMGRRQWSQTSSSSE